MMRWIILAELAIIVVTAIVFAAIHGRSPWRRTAAGRQLMAMAVASGGEAATLLAIGLGWHPPWIFLAIGYGLIDVVIIRWVVLLWWARHQDSQGAIK